MSASGRLKVGVVGLGVGEQHARTFAQHPDCRLRWLYDRDTGRARNLRDVLDEGEVAGSYDAMATDAETDIVSIASNDDDHYAQACIALDHGKHLFVEKPLCRTFREAETLKAKWSAAGKPALDSNLVLRSAPLYRWLIPFIRAGGLGRVYAVDGEYLYGRLHKITHGWRKDVDDYSVLEGGGIHMLDLMLALAEELPERVFATGNRICTEGTDFRYNDFATAIYRFPSGVIGRLTANFGCTHPHHHVIRVYGTKGTFLYDDSGPRLHTSRDPEAKPETRNEDPLPSGKGNLIPGFVDLITSGADTAIQAQRNFDLVCACAAADEALASQQETTIRYV
mgnify:CR=1 FL=1